MKRIIILVAASAALATIGCKGGPGYNLPPMERLMAPGPGVGGPGPGVLQASDFSGSGAVAPASNECDIGQAPMPTVQVMFAKPCWHAGDLGYHRRRVIHRYALVVPGRTNFRQAGLYRVKLLNIPGHEGMELYPTVEIGPANPRTLAYLAHNAVPLQLTVDDFNQVMAGNFVTKVIYLPDPEFQELAVAGVETLVSTRLDPGVIQSSRPTDVVPSWRCCESETRISKCPDLECEAEVISAHSVPTGLRPEEAFARPVQWPGRPIYGMPQSGTPIGLVGHRISRWATSRIAASQNLEPYPHVYPDPTKKIGIHVKQSPVVKYPAPRNKAFITSTTSQIVLIARGAGCHRCGF